MSNELREVTGFRGEKIVELCLTNYENFPRPLFKPGSLGDKWPTIDFYVELTSIRGKRPYFFVQAKSTTSALTATATKLHVTTQKKDIERLLRIPGPTYILGVHEPSRRVFIRSVHTGIEKRAITRIPVAYELTNENLQRLHQEVQEFWQTSGHKPTSSHFT
jgi:hypothetical protein